MVLFEGEKRGLGLSLGGNGLQLSYFRLAFLVLSYPFRVV